MMKLEDADVLARRDRWLIPLMMLGSLIAGAALFGAGMVTASLVPARCPAQTTATPLR